MRLSARDLQPQVSVMPDSQRPVRLKAGGSLTYHLTEPEAINLANQLADAVDELHAHERTTP